MTRPAGAWAQTRAVVLGFGAEGFAAADNLLHLGADVSILDEDPPEPSSSAAQRADLLGVLGARTRFGSPAGADLPEGTTLVIAAGPPPSSPVLTAAARTGVPVIGQVELAWRLRGEPAAPWLVVGGDTGVEETTGLLSAMLRAAGLTSRRCGPGGIAATEAVMDPEPTDVLVVGMASTELYALRTLSPYASALLPTTEPSPATLSWHGSARRRLGHLGEVYQRTEVACLYQVCDPATEDLVVAADVVPGARAIGITTGTPGLSMIGVVSDVLADRAFVDERRTSAAELGTFADLGRDDPAYLVQALTAAGLARSIQVSPGAVRAGLRGWARENR